MLKAANMRGMVNLQVLLNQLTSRGYSVTTADTGEETLEILFRDPHFDLVLLDVMMPDISGFEVCRRIRKKRSLYDLPILMLTAKTRPEDCQTGLEAGANDYVTKPFDKEELLARVQNLITLKQAVQNAIVQARRLESEQRQRESLEQLGKMTDDLTQTLELKEVSSRFLAHMGEAIPCQAAWTVLTKDETGDEIIISAYRTMSGQALTQAEDFQPIIIDSPPEIKQLRGPVLLSQDFYKRFCDAIGAQYSVGSCMALPLVKGDQMFGAVLLFSNHDEPFEETMMVSRPVHSEAAITLAIYSPPSVIDIDAF